MDWTIVILNALVVVGVLAGYAMGHSAGREVMRDIYNLPEKVKW